MKVFRRSTLLIAFSAFAFGGMASPVCADEVAAVDKLLKQGQAAKAQQRADRFLAHHPNDVNMRFRKALSLADQGKIDQAIHLFAALVREHPTRPELRNNLAVLYAVKGDYEKAQLELEEAIATSSAYAAAHRNLGDIYEQRARQAYDRALNVSDKNGKAPPVRLSMIRALPEQVGASETVQVAADIVKPSADISAQSEVKTKPAPEKPVPAPEKPVTVAAAPQPAKPVQVPAQSPQPEPVAPPKPTPSVSEPKPVESAPNQVAVDEAAILAAVDGWAKAWAAKDMDGYFSHYSAKFKAPGGRSAWESNRRARIQKPGSISVGISEQKIRVKDAAMVEVRFLQRYKSASFAATSGKTLEMVQENGRWLILKESVGR